MRGNEPEAIDHALADAGGEQRAAARRRDQPERQRDHPEQAVDEVDHRAASRCARRRPTSDARQQAGDDRQRQRDDGAPDHELAAEERQLPHQHAGVAEQRPAGDEGDGGAGVGADGDEGRGDREDGDRPAGTDRAGSVAIRMPSKPGLGADPAQHRLARHQHGDEGRDQAGRQHLGQDVDEQARRR